MAGARGLARGPRMIVSDLEARLGSRYTLDLVRTLRARYPAVRFVWLMGADNLASFHLWRGWQAIMRLVPVCVVARPGWTLKGRSRRPRGDSPGRGGRPARRGGCRKPRRRRGSTDRAAQFCVIDRHPRPREHAPGARKPPDRDAWPW